MSAPAKRSWTEIRDRISGLILDGTYAPGDKLPRDADLAQRLGCSRATVQRAMRALAEAGRVERVRKGGTTVRADPVTRATLDIPITRREIEQSGAQYGYQLIRQRRAETPPDIMANFDLTRPETMLRIEALHLADRRPFIFENRWISLSTVPEIASVDLTRQSANEWLVRNRPYSRCDLRFFARNATGADASILGVAQGAALLVIERTTWIGAAPITSVRALTTPGYQLVTQS